VSVKYNREIICDEGMNASEWKNISFIIGDRLLNIYSSTNRCDCFTKTFALLDIRLLFRTIYCICLGSNTR